MYIFEQYKNKMDDTHAMFRRHWMHGDSVLCSMQKYFYVHHDVLGSEQRSFRHRRQQRYHYQQYYVMTMMILIVNHPIPATYDAKELTNNIQIS